MLTVRQRDLMALLHERLGVGPTPTYTEIGRALGLKSKSNVARLIDGLVERGFLTKTASRHRSIEILRLPPGRPFDAPPSGVVEIPLLGTVSGKGLDGRETPDGSSLKFAGDGLATELGLSAVRIRGGDLAALDLIDGDLVVFAENRHPVVGSIVLVQRGARTVIGRVLSATRSWVVQVLSDGALVPVDVATVSGVAVNLTRRYA